MGAQLSFARLRMNWSVRNEGRLFRMIAKKGSTYARNHYNYIRAPCPEPRAVAVEGFTFLEALVGIALIGIGVSCTNTDGAPSDHA